MTETTLHIYTRVSSITQAEQGTSLETQLELGIKKANELGFDYKVWNEGGRSSFHEEMEKRPILFALYQAILGNQVKHLFAYDQSRLARNDQVSSHLRLACTKKSVILYTKDAVYRHDSPSDVLMRQILDSIAQNENAVRSERTRLGKVSRVRIGQWHGGPPPFGYCLENKKLVINEIEAKWVKRIFQEVIKDTSLLNIKKMLDSNAVASRRNVGLWSVGSITALLKNTHYKGFYFFKDSKSGEEIQVQCPNIVDIETWEHVQLKRKALSVRKPQLIASSNRFYLLRDLMYCAHCGRGICGRIIDSRAEKSYFCPSRERMRRTESDSESLYVRGRGCGFSRAMNITQTDEMVWNLLKELHSKSSILKEDVRTRIYRDNGVEILNEKEFKDLQAKLRTLQKKHVALSETLGNLEANRVLQEMNEVSYETIVLRVKADISELEGQMLAIRNQLVGATNGKRWTSWIKAFGNEVGSLDDKTDEQKKQYIEALVKRIDVKYIEEEKEHELLISFHLPIVNDGIVWREEEKFVGKGHNKIKYDLKEGERETTLVVQKKGEKR